MEQSRVEGDHGRSDKADHERPAPADPSPASSAVEVNSPDKEPLLVVVTGGSKGIGRSCVESFAQRGARVLFTYCSDAAASQQVEQSFQPVGRVQGRQLDQGDFDSVRSFAAEVDRWREGREISTVVNNAALGSATVSAYGGIPSPPSSAEVTGEWSGAEDYDTARRRADEDIAMMRVNSLGPMWVTESLLPMMMPLKVGGASDMSVGTENSAAATADGQEPAAPAPVAGKSPVDEGLGRGGRAPAFLSFLGTGKKRTVLFVGSVGGGSQSVFPGFRAADAMSKAAVAYACKYFAAQSRQQTSGKRSPAPASTAPYPVAHDRPLHCGSSAAAEAATAKSDLNGASGGVDFVCLCPGATLTDMFRRSTLDKMEAKGPGELERFLNALPQGRLMMPEEVGEAVYWLCSSPAATMFHGAVIDASAGLAVRPGVLTEYTF